AEELGHVTQPYVVIVGGGQGGIALGARLRQLGVPTIIVDRNPRPGDAWRKRYKSLTLHDPVWYDHLPYIDFPPNWPVFSPKDKIADWLEMYTRVMELNYWDSTECKSASYDEAAKEWTVVVEHGGFEMTLRPKQLVLATGMSGKPSMADITVPSIPYRLLHVFQIPVYDAIRERDAEFYARLEKAGFMLDYGDDNSGLFMKYLRRGSGYYIDVGASELVANGDIKLESSV